MKILILILLSSTTAFAESQNFLKRCFLKEYAKDKAVNKVVLGISQDLAEDSFLSMEVQLKNTNGPTAGSVSTPCQVNEKTFVCAIPGDGGKFTFIDEGKTGTLTVNEPVKLKMKNQYFPGKSTVTSLPASTAVTMTEIHLSGCEKLVP